MSTVPAETHAPDPLPDQVTMSLLPYLVAHAVDDDYAHVAARRADAPDGSPAAGPDRRRMVRRAGAAVVLALFALLAVTAGMQTSRDSASDERERRALIEQVKQRRADLSVDRQSLIDLRRLTDELETDLLSSTSQSRGLLRDIDDLALRAGTTPVRGPGVEIVADDAPDAKNDRNRVLDSDLQKLVNGLWQAGAEAISINGERLTNRSAIRGAGSAITVNYTSLSRPYRILAIGDPDTLPSRFASSTTGQAWLDLTREVGLQFTMRVQKTLRLPGTDVPAVRFVESS